MDKLLGYEARIPHLARRALYETRLILLLFVLIVPLESRAQPDPRVTRKVEFPNVPGYQTVKADLHIHTVFSDGSVWPDIRVQEAVRDGLDAIAMTDHLEFQPHSEDIPHPDRNRSYEVATESAENHDLIIINGSEITRDMPPGHSNAIFLKDANPLLQEDPMAVFQEAERQGAFTFWNHPMWIEQKKSGIASLTEMHRQLIREGLLDGIEVVNHQTYSAEALQIALDHDLTILGTSDIHGLIDWDYDVPRGGHRPITLVFVTERSKQGIREALLDGRTAVWFNNMMVGREEYVVPLIEASLTIKRATYESDSSVLNVLIENASDAEYILDSRSDYTFHTRSDVATIEPHGTTRLRVKPGERVQSLKLSFNVMNAVIAPEEHPVITLSVPVATEGSETQ